MASNEPMEENKKQRVKPKCDSRSFPIPNLYTHGQEKPVIKTDKLPTNGEVLKLFLHYQNTSMNGNLCQR